MRRPDDQRQPPPGGPKDQEDGKESTSFLSGGRGGLIWILLFLVALTWLWGPLGPGLDDRTQVSYTEFRDQVQSGNVAEITESGGEITGSFDNPIEIRTEGQTRTVDRFVTHLPSFGDEQLLANLEDQGVTVRTKPPSDFSWWAVLINVLPFLLLIWLGYIFFTRMRSQGQNIFSMGQSGAEAFDVEENERTSFEDVAGLQNAKKELEEIIEFLKDPDRFQRLGGEIPRGVLLVGPPGTGKTLMARAVAGEADVPFFNMTGSDFMEMLVGVGASRIRDLFKEAKEHSPAIIFIDELDSIGRQRGAGLGGGHDEREQTLNQLLSEMDGFEPTHEVVVMAATNRPDILDPALLRPGRFDRRVAVDLPTKKARRAILELHAREKPLSEDVDLDELARGTPGFSGADLKNLLNEGALLAARKDKDRIEGEDVEEARDKVMMGLERENLALDDEEKRLLAYHEGGHAVLAALLPNADPLHKVTIVPRGRAMGVTQQLPEKDKYIYRREYVVDRLAVMMGGRAAEDLVMETATSGAENDLKQATHLARKMVLDWGMSDRFKDIAFGGEKENVFLGEEIARQRQYSDETARDVDQEVQGILSSAYERAVQTLRDNREGLDRLADGLLEKEELTADEVFELLGIDPEAKRDGDRPPGEDEEGPGEDAGRQAAAERAAGQAGDTGDAGDGAAPASGSGEEGPGEDAGREAAAERAAGQAGDAGDDAAPASGSGED